MYDSTTTAPNTGDPIPSDPAPASVCPNCGYCPHCGRGYAATPWYPAGPYPTPYWTPWACERRPPVVVEASAVQRIRTAVMEMYAKGKHPADRGDPRMTLGTD